MRRAYAITSHFPTGGSVGEWRNGQDGARYIAHRFVYEQFEAQGIRDRGAAWTALRAVYAFDPAKVAPNVAGQRLYIIPCGFQREVRINVTGGKPYKGVNLNA